MFLLGEMRRQQHLTQAALSKQLGVSRSTVSMWENEEAQPDNAMLCRLADLFGVSIDALFGRENLDSHLKEEDKKLLSLFCSASELTRQIALYVLTMGHPTAPASFTMDFFALPSLANAGLPAHMTMRLKKAPPQGASYITQIADTSMAPVLQQGDYVFVQYQPYVNHGDIGVFSIEKSVMVRKMVGNSLAPLNPDYAPISLERAPSICCYGIVLHVCDSSYLDGVAEES